MGEAYLHLVNPLMGKPLYKKQLKMVVQGATS
jgi:hypothetical protein